MIKIFEPLDFKNAKPKRPQQAYEVQPGDTLAGIALRHGMKEAEVRAMNNLWDGNVFTGQKLVLHRKKRSQSMPELPGAKEFADRQERQRQLTGKEKEAEPRAPSNQTEEEPVVDDDKSAASPRKAKSRGTLDVIEEQQPLSGFFSALFGTFGFDSSESTTMKDQTQQKTRDAQTSKATRRLKMRSYSERLPTNQEEQDDVYALPKLIGAKEADVLSDTRHAPKLVPKIEAFLPMRLRGYDWKLLYSLSQHGSSLHTLMRKARGERATLIVVETCKGEVFGGFVPTPWANSLSYYGSGESFVFTNVPTFEVFSWKRTNTMFMFSNDNSIAMGGGGGFAWFMNSDLSRGSTSVSETFGNRPLTSEPEFEIAHVEVWGFSMF